MVFQMIVGRAPFDNDTLMDVLIGHLSAPVPPVVSPHGPVPEAVGAILDGQNATVRAFDGSATGTTSYRVFFKDGMFRRSP
jgi:hypothetical protein